MLARYRDIGTPEYLDGRYFEKVMKGVDPHCVTETPLVVRMDEESLYTNEDVFVARLAVLRPIMYARVIIEELDFDRGEMHHFEPDLSYIRERPHVAADIRRVVRNVSKKTGPSPKQHVIQTTSV